MLDYLDYIIGAVFGIVSCLVFYKLSIKQVSKRTDDIHKNAIIKKPFVLICWLIISLILFLALIWRAPYIFHSFTIIKTVEYAIYISILLNLAIVDYLIRKIPNELLLALLVTKVVFIVISLITKEGNFVDTLFNSALGLVIAATVFSIPSFLHISMGAGDVKFAGVIGFCFGFSMFFVSMILMAVILSFYFIYLLITHKGNLKTAIAMGPYLATGVILTMFIPIPESISGFFVR